MLPARASGLIVTDKSMSPSMVALDILSVHITLPPRDVIAAWGTCPTTFPEEKKKIFVFNPNPYKKSLTQQSLIY